MSNHIVQSYHEGDGRAVQSMHSYQSVWMAHWTGTSCNKGPRVHSHLHHLENKEGNDDDAKQCHLQSGVGIASDIPTSTKGFREVTEAGTVKIMNECMTSSSKNLINERLDCQPFPMFNLSQNIGSISTPKNDKDTSCHRLSLMPEIDCNIEYNTIALGTSTSHVPSALAVAGSATETSSREFHFQPEGISYNLKGQGQRGVKLQPLGSSTDSEEKDNVVDAKASEIHLKNESSAETDTMDMDAFKEENHLSGVNSYESNKNIMVDQNALPQTMIASTREEVGIRGPITWLPDINEELPALPAAASSMDNVEPSTSRTQSLDMEHLLSHAEQLSNSKSSLRPDEPLRTEPSSRWVKRLKPNASDSFGLGTKSSNLGEASSHEKVNKSFIKIMKGSITSSEPQLAKRHGKELMAPDTTAALLRNGESSSVDLMKKGRDIMLSHPWIKRWCHNQAATLQKKPKAVVVCEPQSSKVVSDEFQKKQFPSIAAMALMGKAMNGFHQCEFQKRGSFVVWNTKKF